MTGYPVMAGLSRKSMITRVLNIKNADALNDQLSVLTLALIQGASFLRVHDIKEANEVKPIVSEYVRVQKSKGEISFLIFYANFVVQEIHMDLFHIGFLSVRLIDLIDIAIVTFLLYKLYNLLRGGVAINILSDFLQCMLCTGYVSKILNMFIGNYPGTVYQSGFYRPNHRISAGSQKVPDCIRNE